MVVLLYAVFILSGAAGLIYESIWTRYLGLFVGHSAYAQVIVLVIFLGGMSIGALVVGRRSERITRPLLWYAVIELLCGVIGLVFHDVFVVVTTFVYDHVFPSLGLGITQLAVKWAIAGALILPQSILLGTTFPLMSAGIVRRIPEYAGRALSMLYFSNSLGAAIGVLLAGFYLVDLAGLPGTLTVAAMLNLVVAGVVLVALRTENRGTVAARPASPAGLSPIWGIEPDVLWRLLLAVSFGTALSSFIYEIAWIRMLSLVLGSATHSFELMLSAFILGLALGAFWIRQRADRAAQSLRVLGIVQLAMGSLAIATLPVYLASFGWMAGFLSAFARTDGGYLLFSIGRYVICLAVMLPATLCAGMTLPLITRILVSGGTGERAIGQVYGVNTLGSILGAALAGLVLMPMLGLKWLLVAGAVVDLALGAVLLTMEYRRVGRRFSRPAIGVVAALAVGLLVVVATSRFDQTVLTSGVYRYGTVQAKGSRDVLFYRDGRTATVSVRRIPTSGGLTLATNGKPDASLGPEWLTARSDTVAGPLTHDAPTQLFIPLVALAHAPRAKSAVVIGHGSGMTSHALLGSPTLQSLVTIEIEPEMIEASRLFMPANRRAFEDKRSSFVIDDARAFFATQRKTFDLVISEPSNPWVSGVSGLFTTEFYERVAGHLSEDGVFAQWLHLYEIDDGLVLSVLAAIAKHFPAYSIFAMSNRDILIVATKCEVLHDPDWSVLAYPGIAADLHHAWPITSRTMETLRIADAAALAPLLKLASLPNSDYFPTLDLNAERTRFMRSEANGFASLNIGVVNLPAILAGRRVGMGDPYAVVVGLPRLAVAAVAAGMRTGDARAGPMARDAMAQRHAFDLEWALPRRPIDWRLWMRDVALVSASMHGGMAGVADSAFFGAATRFVETHDAPAEARAGLAFLAGLASWDFAGVSRAADLLIPRAAAGDSWIDPDVLRDGAVVAKIRLNDLPGAWGAFIALAPRSAREPFDLRSQLLRAYVTAGGANPASAPVQKPGKH